MKVLVIVASCLLGLTFATDVVELTDENFDKEISGFDTALVEFFAPWCGHCKKLAPEYEKAATALKKNDPPVPLVQVDCIANTAVCGKHGVSGYPTLKIFRGGEVSADYNGERSADGIVSYMKKQVQPASKELKTVEDFEKFLSNENPVVVGFFESESVGDFDAFQKMTATLRDDYTFGHSTSKEVLEKSGHTNVIVLYRPKRLHSKFEEDHEVMSDEITPNNVKQFLEANFNGLCYHMTGSNAGKFKKPLLAAYYDVDYVKNQKGTNYWRNRVMKVGKEFKGKMHFAVANGNDFSQLLGDVGLEMGKSPVVVIQDESDRKYPMTAEFSMDNLRTFIKSYFAGELTPKVKSEPVPEPNDAGVKVVVGETFDQIVMDTSKDVLIEFYAPWCGHCKSLAPKWDELGEKLKGNDDLVIAKLDATANDIPKQFEVRGFPTIYWAPKDGKDAPRKYEGGREVADFITFLDKNASTKLKKEEL